MIVYRSVFSNPSVQSGQRVGNRLLFRKGWKVNINGSKCIPRNCVKYRTMRLALQKPDTVF